MRYVLQYKKRGKWEDSCIVRVHRESTFALYVNLAGEECSFSKMDGVTRDGLDKGIRIVKCDAKPKGLYEADQRRTARRICDQETRYTGTR